MQEHNLSKAKQDVLKFAEEKNWEVTVEDGKIHFRQFFPTKGIKYDVSLSPAGTMLYNVFEGKPVQADLRRGIRRHSEMKQVLNQ